MGNNCVKKHIQLPDDCVKDEKHKIAQPGKSSKTSGSFGHRRLGSTASTVSGDDIKLVWANSKDSSNLFDQLGAKDIFKRFNNFLESWKCWQDEERQCKEMLGFDLDMKLVESLCVIPSGMRLGLGCGSMTEDYDFYLDIDPIIQLRRGDLSGFVKILEYLETSHGVSYKLPAGMQQLDNPEQLKEALMLVKSAVLALKSYGSTITNYIMQQGHNVETVVSNKQSANPTLVIFPRKPITKMKVREMDEKTFMKLNKGDDDEKYIEISLK
ncbi:Hypothetical predicted protein [Paramuricea clavata]|uniref:Uncharacterized protein n=1 Tax=Paramuricea clavata TaxID=317549 RepID=A0A6S7ILN4_PARCT|nr:Hypothetical predicted protein [Paramuricea clavata]